MVKRYLHELLDAGTTLSKFRFRNRENSRNTRRDLETETRRTTVVRSSLIAVV